MKTHRSIVRIFTALLLLTIVAGNPLASAQDATTKMTLGLTGKNITKRSDYTGDTNYWVGSMGWGGTYDWNSIFMQGDGFFDNWGTDMAGAPEAGYVHAQGFQVEHYNNGSTGYGWQMMSGNSGNGNWYLRNIWAGFGPWYKIVHSGNIGSYALSANGGTVNGSLAVLGYVGIGTASPGAPLEIKKPNGGGRLQFVNEGADVYSAINIRNSANNAFQPFVFRSQGFTVNDGTGDRLHVAAGGNVGIGTTSPTALLQVGTTPIGQGFKVGVNGNMANSNAEIANSLAVLAGNASSASSSGAVAWNYYNAGVGSSWSGTLLIHNGTALGGTLYGLAQSNMGELKFQNVSTGVVGSNGAPICMAPAGTVSTTFLANGNVGIGTTNPTQKLAVNGTIRAKEVIVDTNWADYVFDSNYRLAPLSEVESHIKAEKHLPGIPSAQEIAKHGVSMGDMQSKLLSKIEELTLHMIAQEKRMESCEKENASLRQQVRELQTATAAKL